MTEQRFTVKEDILFDNGNYVTHMMKFDEIIKLLNEFHEENQQLSLELKIYKEMADTFANQNKKLEFQIQNQFDLLIEAKKQGFIDF